MSDNKVELLGYYGGDESHSLSAWTSTRRELDNDRRTRMDSLLKMLAQSGHHCYDEQTEILTSQGWKYFSDLHNSDLVASVDLTTLGVEFVQPQEIICTPYIGKMYKVYKDWGIDLVVTPNHNMVVQHKRYSSGYKNDYSFLPALEVAGTTKKYLKAGYNFQNNKLDQQLAKLIGFAVGDGSYRSKNTISFNIRKIRKIEFLKSLGFNVYTYGRDWILKLENIGQWFRENCFNEFKQKKLPDEFIYWGPEDIANLLIGFRNSDGSDHHNGWVYSSTSLQLINQLQMLAAVNGMAMNINPPTEHYGFRGEYKNALPLYRLNVSNRIAPELAFSQPSRLGTESEEWIEYNGLIGCVTVPNGTVIVRRNGKVCVSGNSPFEKSFLHFLVTCDTASHIHIIKHRINVSVNAESARYKEHKEDKYYIPDDWPEDIKKKLDDHIQQSYSLYHSLIGDLQEIGYDRKRAKESARFALPYAAQLNLDVSFNFRSFMHFQGLRNKPDAQKEIREIADKMLLLVKETGAFDYSLAGFGYE